VIKRIQALRRKDGGHGAQTSAQFTLAFAEWWKRDGRLIHAWHLPTRVTVLDPLPRRGVTCTIGTESPRWELLKMTLEPIEGGHQVRLEFGLAGRRMPSVATWPMPAEWWDELTKECCRPFTP
jgi:hypothetical protein